MLRSDRKVVVISLCLLAVSVAATLVKAFFAGPLLMLVCFILLKDDCIHRKMTVVMFIEAMICFIPTNVWISGFASTYLLHTIDPFINKMVKICAYYIASVIEIILVEIAVNIGR